MPLGAIRCILFMQEFRRDGEIEKGVKVYRPLSSMFPKPQYFCSSFSKKKLSEIQTVFQ